MGNTTFIHGGEIFSLGLPSIFLGHPMAVPVEGKS